MWHNHKVGKPEKKLGLWKLEKEQRDAVNAGAARLFNVSCWASYPPSERKEVKWINEVRRSGERHPRMFMMYAEEFEQAPRCLLWVPGKFAYIYLGNPDKGIIVLEPERYMELIPAPDYSGMTVADMVLNETDAILARWE